MTDIPPPAGEPVPTRWTGVAAMRIDPVDEHHTRHTLVAGRWEVAYPALADSWWARWRERRVCARYRLHCLHSDGFADWWCCMCGHWTGGLPPHRCIYCLGHPLEEAITPG